MHWCSTRRGLLAVFPCLLGGSLTAAAQTPYAPIASFPGSDGAIAILSRATATQAPATTLPFAFSATGGDDLTIRGHWRDNTSCHRPTAVTYLAVNDIVTIAIPSHGGTCFGFGNFGNPYQVQILGLIPQRYVVPWWRRIDSLCSTKLLRKASTFGVI